MNITPLGDSALLLCFGASISPAINARVHDTCEFLRRAAWPGILDLVPAYATLGVFYSPDIWDFDTLGERLRALAPSAAARVPGGRHVEVPVCYEAEYAPDLDAVSAYTGLSREALVRRHHAPGYLVYFIGFAPGFPYLGGLDPALHMPRRATPRIKVPAGSVAIGAGQTGIYPQATPGGWHIIGRTPLELFDPDRDPPCLLRARDTLRFVPIDRAGFRRLASGSSRGRHA